jgi:serine/threonine protein kinase
MGQVLSVKNGGKTAKVKPAAELTRPHSLPIDQKEHEKAHPPPITRTVSDKSASQAARNLKLCVDQWKSPGLHTAKSFTDLLALPEYVLREASPSLIVALSLALVLHSPLVSPSPQARLVLALFNVMCRPFRAVLLPTGDSCSRTPHNVFACSRDVIMSCRSFRCRSVKSHIPIIHTVMCLRPRQNTSGSQYNKEQVKEHTGFHDYHERGTLPDLVPNEDIYFGDRIGEGNFGIVYSGYLYGQEVALKKLKPSIDEEVLEDFENEIAILRDLRHPNIINYMGACHGEMFVIITEFIDGFSLDHMVAADTPIMSRRKFINLATNIASGLSWLHNKKIIHRDIKPANIMVCGKFMQAKICDFGLSHRKRRHGTEPALYGTTGTPTYMAPEVLEDMPYSVAADIFSFAIILVEMLINKYPYGTEMYKASMNNFQQRIVDGERPTLPEDTEATLPGLTALIRSMWLADPSKRPLSMTILDKLGEIDKQRKVNANEVLEDLPADVVKMLKDDMLHIGELKNQNKTLRGHLKVTGAEINELNQIIRVFRQQAQTIKEKFESGRYLKNPDILPSGKKNANGAVSRDSIADLGNVLQAAAAIAPSLAGVTESEEKPIVEEKKEEMKVDEKEKVKLAGLDNLTANEVTATAMAMSPMHKDEKRLS